MTLTNKFIGLASDSLPVVRPLSCLFSACSVYLTLYNPCPLNIAINHHCTRPTKYFNIIIIIELISWNQAIRSVTALGGDSSVIYYCYWCWLEGQWLLILCSSYEWSPDETPLLIRSGTDCQCPWPLWTDKQTDMMSSIISVCVGEVSYA